MSSDLSGANEYFLSRLNSEVWFDAHDDTKNSALAMAKDKINRLPFIGTKLMLSQQEAFPRSYNGMVINMPEDVEKGIYEEALYLLLNSENLDTAIPDGVQSLSLGSASISFKNSGNGNSLSKNSAEFVEGWLKKGFDTEPQNFKEVY